MIFVSGTKYLLNKRYNCLQIKFRKSTKLEINPLEEGKYKTRSSNTSVFTQIINTWEENQKKSWKHF